MSERWADAAIQEYVAAKDVVILGTIDADGAPRLTPMWFWHDETALVMITPARSGKARNVVRDARVSVLAESGTRRDIKRVAIAGRAEVMPSGAERDRAVAALCAKYHPLVEDMWGGARLPPDRVVLRIIPGVVRSAGLRAAR